MYCPLPMATTDAISAVCNSLCYVLRSSIAWPGSDLPDDTGYAPTSLARTFGKQADSIFSVCTTQSLIESDVGGETPRVSIFLYRVLPNPSQRNLAGRLNPQGDRQLNQLSVDLHLLALVWAKHAETQHRFVGWVMRTLEDYPILPASVLNRGARPISIPASDASEDGATTPESVEEPRIFHEDESVELLLGDIPAEELLQLWDTLGKGNIPLPIAIPYVVRNVCLESYRSRPPEAPTQQRVANFALQTRGPE